MTLRNFEVDYEKLYSLAKERGETRSLEADLYFLKKSLEANYDAKMFFEDLAVKKESRISFLKEAFPTCSSIVLELVSFLIDNEEAPLLSEISEKYTRFLAEKEKLEFAELILADDLSQDELKKIRGRFSRNTSFKVTKNLSILGGFVVRKIDGTVIDASVRGRLEQLRRGIIK